MPARLEAPATPAALQRTASPTRAEAAPVAAPASPPAPVVALPTPPAPPASVQRVTTASGAGPAARERLSEAPDDELEELADWLYDHISARFRAELLIDRERAGMLADVY
jgi:predicted flap endonuclease-1-like 5' DNA nuclease